MVERSALVAKPHEGSHISHVLTDVDDFESLVALYLLVDISAIGTGGHAINFNHNLYSLR